MKRLTLRRLSATSYVLNRRDCKRAHTFQERRPGPPHQVRNADQLAKGKAGREWAGERECTNSDCDPVASYRGKEADMEKQNSFYLSVCAFSRFSILRMNSAGNKELDNSLA